MLDAGQNIITRHLPKTGQVTEYAAGDDGTYEAGWWPRRLNANNRTRFLTRTIGGDDVVLDRATGLMWAADGSEAGCNNGNVITWANAITYANGLNFAGFTDWRLPNKKELHSLVNYGIANPCIDEPPFSNTALLRFWSSTTYLLNTLNVWTVKFTSGIDDGLILKTSTQRIRCVRKGV